MRRVSIALLGLFAAASLHAAATLTVSLSPIPARVERGATITWTATVTNLGPDAAHNVRLRSSIGSVQRGDQTFDVLAAGESRSINCNGVPGAFAYSSYVYASADASDTKEASTFTNFDVNTPPDMRVYLTAEPTVDAGLPFPLKATFANLARTVATGVTLTIDLSGGVPAEPLPAGCTASGTRVVCSLGTVQPSPDRDHPLDASLTLNITAPDLSLATISATGRIAAQEGDADTRNDTYTESTETWKTFYVTTTADAGNGSLRAAINDANNAQCSSYDPCKISFRIPASGAKWHTIKLVDALPRLTAEVVLVDAMTQRRYIADSNPDGPEIEISGAALKSGNGLQLTASCTGVHGLAINGFPSAGITAGKGVCYERGYAAITNCYVGTDPTGTIAIPNEYGILLNGGMAVGDSIISGNRRSGVYAASGQSVIYRSIIGMNAAKNADLGNGASGVYIASAARGTDVSSSHIAFNHHSGVSIHPDASYVELRGNSIHANWQLGVDYALNGVTKTIPVVGLAGNEMPIGTPASMTYPEITSATYDPVTDMTTIELKVDATRWSPGYNWYYANIYANDAPDASGFGEGQYDLGQIEFDNLSRTVFHYRGRTPGPWISATATVFTYFGFLTKKPDGSSWCGDCGSTYTTSEFGPTVRVK